MIMEKIRLVPWSELFITLLYLQNTLEMTKHLGGTRDRRADYHPA